MFQKSLKLSWDMKMDERKLIKINLLKVDEWTKQPIFQIVQLRQKNSVGCNFMFIISSSSDLDQSKP
jgi:hypothetical protein